ncbi:MAG: pirin family protein [Xanthomonadaceae bacterium]|nr:pirin family protein [Xanthomonadaceae bacterium]
MNSPRHVDHVYQGLATSDGAGVRLVRMLGTAQLPDLDPFLMLDAFGSDQPGDYIAGFPDHPHRGFETVTYMLDGRMRHRDNHGHEGLLGPGSVQWMSAGRGIVHSEMPEQVEGLMRGFQLWLNLPARDKMSAPRYQEYAAEQIPVVTPAAGVQVKVIAGQLGEVNGVIEQPATEPVYLDIQLDPAATITLPLPLGHSAFVHVYQGAAQVDDRRVATGELAVLGDGDAIQLQGGDGVAHLLLVAGRPLREPVARHGPFVMNTQAELVQAFNDYRAGRF